MSLLVMSKDYNSSPACYMMYLRWTSIEKKSHVWLMRVDIFVIEILGHGQHERGTWAETMTGTNTLNKT